MDEVKDMVQEYLDAREEREFKAQEDSEMRREQVRRDFAELGRTWDPYD